MSFLNSGIFVSSHLVTLSDRRALKSFSISFNIVKYGRPPPNSEGNRTLWSMKEDFMPEIKNRIGY